MNLSISCVQYGSLHVCIQLARAGLWLGLDEFSFFFFPLLPIIIGKINFHNDHTITPKKIVTIIMIKKRNEKTFHTLNDRLGFCRSHDSIFVYVLSWGGNTIREHMRIDTFRTWIIANLSACVVWIYILFIYSMS